MAYSVCRGWTAKRLKGETVKRENGGVKTAAARLRMGNELPILCILSSHAVYADNYALFILFSSRFSFSVFCAFFFTFFLVSRPLLIHYPFLAASYYSG
jgi:hypothetical protein